MNAYDLTRRWLAVTLAGLGAITLCGCGQSPVASAQGSALGSSPAAKAPTSATPAPIAAPVGEPPQGAPTDKPAVAPAPAAGSPAPGAPAAKAPATGAAAPKRPLPPPGSDGVRDLSFDDIKFPMEKTDPFKRTLLTRDIESLDGTPIRIRGYILPGAQQDGLTEFVLVRDNMECCFGPGAALYDCILIQMADDKTTSFNALPIKVEGTFSVNEIIGPDGRHLAIYKIDATSAQ